MGTPSLLRKIDSYVDSLEQRLTFVVINDPIFFGALREFYKLHAIDSAPLIGLGDSQKSNELVSQLRLIRNEVELYSRKPIKQRRRSPKRYSAVFQEIDQFIVSRLAAKILPRVIAAELDEAKYPLPPGKRWAKDTYSGAWTSNGKAFVAFLNRAQDRLDTKARERLLPKT